MRVDGIISTYSVRSVWWASVMIHVCDVSCSFFFFQAETGFGVQYGLGGLEIV